jgi:hypothetical protein
VCVCVVTTRVLHDADNVVTVCAAGRCSAAFTTELRCRGHGLPQADDCAAGPAYTHCSENKARCLVCAAAYVCVGLWVVVSWLWLPVR